jgi:hypothetical protein
MSLKKDENNDEDKDEDVKWPPRHVPLSNPNEVRASQKDEEAVAIEEGVPLEEKDKITGVDPQNLADKVGIDIEHPDTSGDQRVVWLDNGDECSWWQIHDTGTCTDTGALVNL